MKNLIAGAILLVSLCLNVNISAQSLKQTIRGKITDIDSKEPLIGVGLYIEGSEPRIGVVSGPDGSFEFPSLLVGRYNIVVSYVSYEQKIIPNVLLGAGKEVYLNIDLKQRGVGGDNSWGALPHEPYRLLDKKYSYSYIIKLIDGK